ncbi:MAG: MFS transporter [Firmicutes bacterium]|nr:MFS transporter [Bacillota bacterium]
MKHTDRRGRPADPEILLPQKHLNMTFFVITIMVITTIQWITLDMYLPALPILKEEFHTTESMLNITINAGIVTTAVSTLFSGTLSDRFGRKPVLLIGLIGSAVCTFLCAFSGSVLSMAVLRAAGGLGTGSVLTVTSAMIKDSFSGRRFERSMTLLQSIAAMGPLLAPTLGSVLINISSWHSIFYFLGIATGITAIPILISTETWPKEIRVAEHMSAVIKEALSIARAPAFALFLGIAAFLTIPVWAYIAVSSYVYINDFGISNVAYGILYGVGAGMSIIAPFLYMLLVRRLSGAWVVTITVAMVLTGASSLLLIGRLHPLIFLFSIVPLMIAEGMIRPLSIVVLLEEYSHAAGSASALMQFACNLVGIVGTSLATLAWSSMITGTGLISLGCGLMALLLWILMRRRDLLRGRLGY